jgi:hypothetical protein
MYADPSLIRDHVVKLRLNDGEAALVDALVAYTGQQKAAFLRELLLEQARSVLAGEADVASTGAAMEVPAAARVGV